MIESYSFGSMTITGQSHRNDLKIIENKIVGNWWRREGHALYAQDIDDILYASVETLVVGTGAYGGMKVTEEAAQAIEGQGISLWRCLRKKRFPSLTAFMPRVKELPAPFI